MSDPHKKNEECLLELDRQNAIYDAINSLSFSPHVSAKVASRHGHAKPSGKAPNFIHYTSLASFQAMIKPFAEDGKDYITLFASRMQFLNDSKEYMLGRDVVKRHVTNGEFDENIYVSCFCGKRDLLSQWKYYGKDSGIAMEFDFGDDCELMWWGADNTTSDGFELIPHRVLYDGEKKLEEKYNAFVEIVKNRLITMSDSSIATAFIPFCKDPAFKEEDESRLIFMPVMSGPEGERTKIKYRVTGGKIVPQFEVIVFYADKRKDRIPIRSVMIGPGYNQLLNFNAVIHMLDRTNGNVPFFTESDVNVKNLNKNLRFDPDPDDRSKQYVTYETKKGIKVQLSPTSFRS